MDKKYMQRCFEIANNSLGYTYPNPIVGAVITHQKKIIGEGWHLKAGEAHAEINAINAVKRSELIRKSDVYVSLEPCSHKGKTPSCANRLVEEKVNRIYIGTTDFNPIVCRKGIKILSNAAIPLQTDILQNEAKILNKRFFTFHLKKRPYIILKWSESQDGFLDKDFKSTQISNTLSNQFVHQLRSRENAILVGTRTVLNDDPSLTTRYVFGRNPKRVVIDLDLKIPLESKIFDHETQTFIFNSKKEISINNIHYIKVSKLNFIKNLLNKLYLLQIQSIIIEGGAHTLKQFIDVQSWDEAIIIKTPLILKNGTKAPSIEKTAFHEVSLREDKVFFYKNNTDLQ